LETVLSITNLHKKFGQIHAVKNLSFDVQKGHVYGLLGPNGSGKSTTLGIILNVVNKTSGDFSWFNGHLPTSEALKKVGAIVERPNFYPYMTAKQNLSLICKIKGISTDKINEKLRLVNLYERRNSRFEDFSLGMKQRLAIASALINDPEILILDEPTNGLDPQGIHEIRQIIKEIAGKGTTILLASHLLDEVEKVCSHVIIIRKGRKLFSGHVDEVTSSKGFFELKVDQQHDKLLDLLQNHRCIGRVRVEDDLHTAQLKEEMKSSEMNEFLFKNGVIVSHLIKRKPSLEEQFLQLTNNKL